jgi:hypothetical protein
MEVFNSTAKENDKKGSNMSRGCSDADDARFERLVTRMIEDDATPKWLDEHKIPRMDKNGKQLSVVSRLIKFQNKDQEGPVRPNSDSIFVEELDTHVQ